MVSKLMACCESVNGCFDEYKFGDAQQASYSYWLDDLCDVYLEMIKPVVYDKSEENSNSRWAAQATLWIALEAGLRILHPMMPFVSEELWQRMPGRGTLGADEPVSIMVTKYPECNSAFRDTKVEESMDVVMKVVKACRQLRQSYTIANKVLTHFYVKIESGAAEDAVKSQVDDIKTLGKAETVAVNPDESTIPKSHGIVIIDDQTTVLMDLTGLVDFGAEIVKLQKSLKKTMPSLIQLEKKMAASGYEKVNDDIKTLNAEKLDGLKKKVADIEAAIENYTILSKLEKK
jgi:valyl-tRNA synthetase